MHLHCNKTFAEQLLLNISNCLHPRLLVVVFLSAIVGALLCFFVFEGLMQWMMCTTCATSLVWKLNINLSLLFFSLNTITVIYVQGLVSATDSAVANRLDLSLPQFSQKALTSQKGSLKMAFPLATIKVVFSFDYYDKRSEGLESVQGLGLTPLIGDIVYFNMTVWKMHLFNHKFMCKQEIS